MNFRFTGFAKLLAEAISVRVERAFVLAHESVRRCAGNALFSQPTAPFAATTRTNEKLFHFRKTLSQLGVGNGDSGIGLASTQRNRRAVAKAQ